jgi:hypothetical protein
MYNYRLLLWVNPADQVLHNTTSGTAHLCQFAGLSFGGIGKT